MKYLLKPWLILVLIFLAGMLSGAALSVVFGPRFMHPPGEAQLRAHMRARLTRALDLTDEQRTKIEPIVAQTARDLQAVHHEELGRVSEIFRKPHDQIAAVISPAQKAQLDRLEAEREKAFGRHGFWGGPPHSPGGEPERDGPADRPPPPSPGP